MLNYYNRFKIPILSLNFHLSYLLEYKKVYFLYIIIFIYKSKNYLKLDETNVT